MGWINPLLNGCRLGCPEVKNWLLQGYKLGKFPERSKKVCVWLRDTHRIHVWYIYLHLVDFYGKCRWIYHTWILWDMVSILHSNLISRSTGSFSTHLLLFIGRIGFWSGLPDSGQGWRYICSWRDSRLCNAIWWAAGQIHRVPPLRGGFFFCGKLGCRQKFLRLL